MALEATGVAKIIKHLNRMPRTKVWKNHGSAASEPGIPDIIGTSDGRFIGFEAKKRGEYPSFLQSKTLHALHSTGACVGVVRDVEDAGYLLTGRDSKRPTDRERCALCQLPVNGRGRLCYAVAPTDAVPGLDEEDSVTVPEDFCARCGHPRSNHPTGHLFQEPTGVDDFGVGYEDVI